MLPKRLLDCQQLCSTYHTLCQPRANARRPLFALRIVCQEDAKLRRKSGSTTRAATFRTTSQRSIHVSLGLTLVEGLPDQLEDQSRQEGRDTACHIPPVHAVLSIFILAWPSGLNPPRTCLVSKLYRKTLVLGPIDSTMEDRAPAGRPKSCLRRHSCDRKKHEDGDEAAAQKPAEQGTSRTVF